MKASIRIFAYVLLLSLGLSACGNKGNLVLPDAPDTADAAAQSPSRTQSGDTPPAP